MTNSLQPHGLQPASLLYPWNSPGKKTGVRSHSLLQVSSQTKDQTWVFLIEGNSLPSQPPEKSMCLDRDKYTFTYTQEYALNTFINAYICVCVFSSSVP